MQESTPGQLLADSGRKSSQHLSLLHIFLLLMEADFPYQYAYRYLSLTDSLCATLIDATLFTAILWITTRRDLARVSLCFLALPYLIFIPGWLNIPAILLLLPVFIFCLMTTLRDTRSTSNACITAQDILAFLLIIAWVNVSGAGGYSHQSPDYALHNARLNDLINYPWPVHYGDDQNFVSYFGYFLSAAVIGKISTVDAAFRFMYPWTILGVTLALRWASFLSGWRFSIGLAALFILFGPVDILNVILLGLHSNIPLNSSVAEMLVNSDYLDFRSRLDLGFFIGNYVSNTFQLFWSPHQVIAGWISIGLLTHLFFSQKFRQFVFVYALLCLWSPLIMIALLPFVFLAAMSVLLKQQWREVLTVENVIGGGLLALLFVTFYLGGSAASLPSSFLFDHFDWAQKDRVLTLFYLSAWGIYALAQISFLSTQPKLHRIWFLCLMVALLVLSLKKFGAYSDLLCRGSAPLMFLLLIFILQALKFYWQQKQHTWLAVMSLLLILGSGSALLQFRQTFLHYTDKSVTGNIIEYTRAHPDENENLGPDASLFNHYLRRTPEK